MYSRREFGKLTLAALALPRTLTAAVDSKVKGVRFGVQTYSFRDLPRPEGGDAVDVMIQAMHGHSKVDDPSEFATPESFAAALKMSRYFKVNLDIGHFTAGNFDAVAYVREHHADITNLHIKDRKKNQGENTPWGEGDTPIREVLQLVEKNKWPIPADIEYEYRGTGTPVEEVKKCYAYARQA